MRIVNIIICLSSLYLSGCDDGYLRGSVSPSEDGKTYLSIIDNNGGQCGPIYVDGKVWPHKISKEALIAPGTHTIECGTKIEFEIPKGVLFKFDYWGP